MIGEPRKQPSIELIVPGRLGRWLAITEQRMRRRAAQFAFGIRRLLPEPLTLPGIGRQTQGPRGPREERAPAYAGAASIQRGETLQHRPAFILAAPERGDGND